MLAATNQMQGESKRQWKKVNENTYDISSIKSVTKKFLEVSRCGRSNNGKEKYKKKVCCSWKVAFLLIRPFVVFHRSTALPSFAA